MRIARECPCCGSRELISSPAVVMPFVAHRAFGWAPVTIDESWSLRTVPSGHAYSVCNSLQCNDCHFLFSDFRFDDAELESLYGDYRGEEYVALRERYEPGYGKRNEEFDAPVPWLCESERFIAEHVTGDSPRVLDYGGDTGMNTPFRGRASVCHIYDISEVDTLDGAEQVSYAEAQMTDYDVIVSTMVAEHVPEPRELLAAMRELMSDKTLLFLEVPREGLMREHGDGLTAVFAKRYWHEHINFYSKESLKALFGAAGLGTVAERELPRDGFASNVDQYLLVRRES